MRQPGSSFKPFVYITALEQGIPPNQELLDEPIEVMSRRAGLAAAELQRRQRRMAG